MYLHDLQKSEKTGHAESCKTSKFYFEIRGSTDKSEGQLDRWRWSTWWPPINAILQFLKDFLEISIIPFNRVIDKTI